METHKEKLEALRHAAKSKLNVLIPSNAYQGKFKPANVYFDGYTDLFTTIECLLNVCIQASQVESFSSLSSRALEYDIQKVLELTSSLLPFEEGQFLDDVYQMLIAENNLKTDDNEKEE